ncbi:threonine-phosphate decarboxylase CobD [Ectopseudomonas hydrolytica]|uniref:threonine-phosphate decarboxylase CobD n=1 Tax=Ectopseudomonas hydrolytica TaxID=2493633 RepID=UPI0018A7C9BC|nr:threonine-phosphate decarboxylase CobD [Pseudomonas hydrolytica]MBF8161285.1 threonine-phosphate decarboxylase [Pseudomonas mendocina]UTH29981.1 threonine-phosphate decarboxylase CobD [Pseudomonas hydrolytica]UZZ08927.1 threonine-phosphate decarboxylase CobD [Pseudomonas mendocina]
MLEHGGRLRAAAQRYGIPLEDWLDLSTGIAPYGWDLPPVPAQAWARLPEINDGLEAAARDYYGAASLLPVAGSQAAIQALPRLRTHSNVGILAPTYAEHAAAWRREGHRITKLSEGSVHRALPQLDVLLVVNPNNPTGRLIEPARLLDWHDELAERGGWLVVDEAFIDCTPQHSLAAYSDMPGLIVLRSFGKFFGLAGLRLGFVLAAQALLDELDALLGPWAVSGPARSLARHLLADSDGQRRQRERLLADGERLAALLRDCGLPPTGGSALFQFCCTRRAVPCMELLARRGILIRLFAELDSLRFGLPADEAGWLRLEQGLLDCAPILASLEETS